MKMLKKKLHFSSHPRKFTQINAQTHAGAPSMNIRCSTIILSLILLGGCSKDSVAGFIGKAYTLSVDIPEDSQDMDFVWDVAEKPSASALKYNDFDFTDDFAHMTFVPDAEGLYLFEVKIFQYNDEIASQSFSFEIIDDGFRPEQDMLPIATKDPTSVQTDPISETASAEEIEIPATAVIEEADQKTEIEVQIVETVIKARTKAKKSRKPVLGRNIPFDAGRFTIQVASKKNLEDAKRVAADLIKDGFDAYIQKAYFEETDAVWFRVRVGSYNDRELAKKVAANVSKIMTEPAWVDFVRYEE